MSGEPVEAPRVPGARADFLCIRCEDAEAGTGGPFLNLPIKKPACPNCRARRWMQRQWSGYVPLVSSTGLTPTQLGSNSNGRRSIQATEMLGVAGYDDQRNRARMARHRQPGGPMIVRPDMLGDTLAKLTNGKIQQMPGLQAGSTTPESLRPVTTLGGLAQKLQPLRPGPGSKIDRHSRISR